MSVKIFENIVEDKGMLGRDLSQTDVDRIKAMILASHKGKPANFCFEISAKKRVSAKGIKIFIVLVHLASEDCKKTSRTTSHRWS